MNNEIKEILDYLKESAIKQNLYFEINPEKAKILLDYITNLQSKIEAYELFDNQKIANLQEENNRLNNIINELEKYLEERVSKSVLKGCSFEQTYITGKWDAYKNSLNKLQELKGDSSND